MTEKKDDFLNKQGWNVFRIGYTENNDQTIKIFLDYISQFKTDDKKLQNRVFKYKEITFKNNEKLSWNEYIKIIKQKNIELNEPLINLVKNSNIDFSKFGWVNKVAILINKKPQKINGWMKKYMFDFYNEKCFKRKIKLAGREGTAPPPGDPNSPVLLLHQRPVILKNKLEE